MRRMWQGRYVLHVVVLAVYGLLAVGLTWPLVAHLGTHVPGSDTWAYDEYTFLWNSWWFRYAVLDLGQNPLYSTHIFYPLGISLALHTYNLFNALVSVPLQPFLPLPAISNLTFLASTVLSGYGTFLLARYLLAASDKRESGSRIRAAGSKQQGGGEPLAACIVVLAAFLAGLIYAFGSYRLVYAAIGHYDMWSTQWIPFYTLFLIKTIREPGRRNAVVAGVFLVLAMLCEMSFGVFLGMLTLILVVGQRRPAGGWGALLGRLALLGGLALILYAPVLVPVLAEMFGGYELAGWGDAQKLSVDLVGLVTPTALHPLLKDAGLQGGEWVSALRQAREGTGRFADVNTVFLGWAGLALAVAGAVRYGRRVAAWAASAVMFAVLALGPVLQINGRSLFDLDGLAVNVPLPFIVLHYIPIVKANRVPNRFSVVLMLAVAVLAAYGAGWLLRVVSRIKVGKQEVRRWLLAGCALLLAVLLVGEHLAVPLPLTDARIPAVYDQVAAEPGDFAILQLPLGWRNSFGQVGAEDTQKQYYQSYHHKRLLSGNISRNPPYKFGYFRAVPILESLVTIETYGEVDAARRAADRASAQEFVSFYDVRYVVVAPGGAGRPPHVDTRDGAVVYIEEVLPVERIYDQDGWLLYRVDRAGSEGATVVDFGSSQPLAAMARGEGWAEAETIQGVSANWAIAQEAQVFLPGAAGSDYRLTVTALPFAGVGTQQAAARVNGQRLAQRLTLQPGWASVVWDVPAELVREGVNDVRLEWSRLAAPADVMPEQGAIGSTGVQAPLAIEVNSGGAADFAYITVGEGSSAQDGSAHQPGYNVAVIDAESGQLVDRQGFDTTAGGDVGQAQALADFIAGLRPGQIVVVAAQGDATARLTAAAVDAMRTIGAQVDPRGLAGGAHAIIGVKGAAPGTALEVAGPGGGWLRAAADRRTLAAAVDTIRWERIGAAPTEPVP